MPLRSFPRAAVLAAACLFALPGVVAAAESAPDIAAEWQALLAGGNDPKVYSAFSVAIDVLDEQEQVVEAACREQADALEQAARDAALSAFVVHTAYRCAEARGDEDAAERHAARFAAVARHALAMSNPDREAPPIRVLAGRDIYTILRASGLEWRYERFEPFPQGRHLVVLVAAWDPEKEIERLLRFDYLEPLLVLRGRPGEVRFPVPRIEARQALARDLANARMLIGRDWLAAIAAGREAEGPARVAALREVANDGGILASSVWFHTCVRMPHPQCGEELLDVLLPRAEAGHAFALVHVAAAYAAGVGVARDEDAAMQLLDRANARLPGGAAVLQYARLLQEVDVTPTPALRERLVAAAAAGNAQAEVVLLEDGWRDTADAERRLTEAQEAALRRHAEAGSVAALDELAADRLRRERTDDALPWLRRAAALGSPYAQRVLANLLERGGGDAAEVRRLREQSAQGGDALAMLLLGWQDEGEGRTADALQWYSGAAVYALPAGRVAYARLLLQTDASADAARRAVNQLAEADTPEARRMLAMLHLEGERVPRDPAKARALLEADAARGDRSSQATLARSLLEGRFGAPDADEAQRWLRDGLAEFHPVTVDAWAMYLAYESGEADGRERAVALYREALAKRPEAMLFNNAAWLMCTTAGLDATVRREGLEAARRIGDPEAVGADAMPLGYLDTVAACHAAVGEFARASALQQRVVDAIAASDADDPSLPAMRERLAHYRDGRAWLETPEAVAAQRAADEAAATAARAERERGVAPADGEDALRYRGVNKGQKP